MDHWAKEVHTLEEKMEALAILNPVQYERLEIYMLGKYVDDVLTILEKMKKGVRWDPTTEIFMWSAEAQEEDTDRSPEEVTRRAFCSMATSVMKCLNFTWDSPDQHVEDLGGKMPVLDTMMWIGKGNRKWGVPEEILEPETCLPEYTGSMKDIVLYMFFRKSMANRTPMHSRAAAPEKDRVQTVANEFLRRLKNTSRELAPKVVEQVIQEYACDLKRGGFHSQWIRLALEAACRGYERMIGNQIRGTQPVNRPESFGRKSRRLKKITGKSTWFKVKKGQEEDSLGVQLQGNRNRGHTKSRKTPTQLTDVRAHPETVLFVPHTPNGELKKLIQQADTQVSGRNPFGRVKVVETLGPKLNNQLSNTAPWRKDHCGRDKCLPCETKEGSCKVRNLTYSIECLECNHIYWGESHRTWYDRSQEHGTALKNMDEKNPLVKHQMLHHPGRSPNFKFKVDKTWKSSLGRQIREAILINQEDPNRLMNSKSEWGNNGIPRITIEDTRPPEVPSPAHQTPDTQKHGPSEHQQAGPNRKRKKTDLAPPSIVPSANIKKLLLRAKPPQSAFSGNSMSSPEVGFKSSTSAELDLELTPELRTNELISKRPACSRMKESCK